MNDRKADPLVEINILNQVSFFEVIVVDLKT
jgi:hypothetical protein